jgi:hypothetical protein
MPDGGVRLPGDHALLAALGIGVHGLGETAHKALPGPLAAAYDLVVESKVTVKEISSAHKHPMWRMNIDAWTLSGGDIGSPP